MKDHNVVKYGKFISLDEEFDCDTQWFDDIRNVTIFLKMLALKKIAGNELTSLVSK